MEANVGASLGPLFTLVKPLAQALQDFDINILWGSLTTTQEAAMP